MAQANRMQEYARKESTFRFSSICTSFRWLNGTLYLLDSYLLGKITELEQTSQVNLTTVLIQDSLSPAISNSNASPFDPKARTSFIHIH